MKSLLLFWLCRCCYHSKVKHYSRIHTVIFELVPAKKFNALGMYDYLSRKKFASDVRVWVMLRPNKMSPHSTTQLLYCYYSKEEPTGIVSMILD